MGVPIGQKGPIHTPSPSAEMHWPWRWYGNLYGAAASTASDTWEREGRLECLINRVVVMDFYLGNNNEVKLGRFPAPKRGPDRPTISIGVVREKKSIKMPIPLCCL